MPTGQVVPKSNIACPNCKHDESKVTDSRGEKNCEVIHRRRECMKCRHRWTTYESSFDQRRLRELYRIVQGYADDIRELIKSP